MSSVAKFVKKSILWLSAGWLMAMLVVVPARNVQGKEVTPEQVRQAIKRGVAYLKSKQDKRRGNWEEHLGQPNGGTTALCALALINAGEDIQGPTIQRALKYLRSVNHPKMTYSTALRTMVFCAAEPEKDIALIRRNANWLQRTQKSGQGKYRGSWGYSGGEGRRKIEKANMAAGH